MAGRAHPVSGGASDDSPRSAAQFFVECLENEGVEHVCDLAGTLSAALAEKGPVIVDIPIDYRENDKLGVDLWQLAPEALA